ncbi:MAG TPA: c-type cytochrome [Casimicrobiaceae bacterium]
MTSLRTFRRPLRRAVGVATLASALLGAMQNAAAQVASPQLVERGRYLARAGDCISCHTAKGGAAYAGGLRMDTPFGALFAPNITPDVETGIGAWSANEFYRAMHEGINKRGQDMYPAMPYTFFTRVTREDCDAIYTYLRTVKPVRNAVDVNQLHWPFDMRWTMATWRELYFTSGTWSPDPLQSSAWNRGAYLIEGLGHCSACHSPRNALGAIEKNKAFTGANIDGWFALNLTENLNTGLGEWEPAQIVAYLKTGAAKTQSTTLGPMAEVVHNSLAYLTDADLQAMATYLKTLPANSGLRTPWGEPDPTKKRGGALYTDHCSGCHQARGGGIIGVFPPLASNGVVVAPDPANVIKVVLQGIPARNRYVAMPSFAGQLTDQQIADLANYVRTSWGNVAPPNATPAMVAKLRGNGKGK